MAVESHLCCRANAGNIAAVPWVSIKGAIKRLRIARGWDQAELVKKTGLSTRLLRLYESNSSKVPKTMNPDTVKRLAQAFELDPKAREYPFAKIVPYASRDIPDAEIEIDDPVALPQVRTLNLQAEQEQQVGRRDSVVTAAGEFDVLGPTLLARCDTAYDLYRDHCFGVTGIVKQHRRMPPVTAAVLGTKPGVGALFQVTRKITKAMPFFATVFTKTADHTRALLDHTDAKKKVVIIVRLVAKPADGDWKGFFVFELPRKKPTPLPYAFVVEEIIDSQG